MILIIALVIGKKKRKSSNRQDCSSGQTRNTGSRRSALFSITNCLSLSTPHPKSLHYVS